MPQIIVLPHVELCPEGAVIDAKPGDTICDTLLANGVEIEHACEKSCACTTCHVIVREGFNSLEASTEEEDDLLDKAWGYELFPSTRTVDNFIVRLRRRFERDPQQPQHFHTVRGVGYRFTVQGESS